MTGPGIERTGINGYGQTNPQLLMMAIMYLVNWLSEDLSLK